MLEKPIRIGSVELKNRLVMAPVDMQQSDHGTVTDVQVKFFDERTRGGNIGLVIVEHSFVSPEGRASELQLSNSKEEDVEGLTRLAGTIHKNGSAAVNSAAAA